MTTTSTVTPIRTPGPFEAIMLEAAAKLQALAQKAPRGFSIFPIPDEFLAVKECFSEAAAICDEMYAAIGHELADNAPCKVDMKLFLSPVSDAIDGNALYEFERCAEVLIEDHNEMIRERA